VAESTGDFRYAESARIFFDSGRLWHVLGSALLAGGTTDSREDHNRLVDRVVDTVRSAMDFEKRALGALALL
jgi:hypothetical protein